MKTRGWSTKPDGDYVTLRTTEIWRYMKRRDWTVAELARRADLSRSYMHRLLNGQAFCDEGKARRIAEAFDVTVEAIADEQVAA